MDPRTAVTIDLNTRDPELLSPSSFPPASTSRTAGVHLVEGTRPHLSAETQSLLRERLRAAALLFLIGSTLFFVRNLFLEVRSPFLQTAHALLEIGLATAFLVLSSRWSLSMLALRSLELSIFGMLAVYFTTLHFCLIRLNAEAGDPLRMLATVKNTVLMNFCLIVVYGLFIPSTWRRTACVVGLIATLPIAVAMWMRWFHPEVLRGVRQVLTFENLSDNALMLTIAVITAVYGSALIHRLRTEVFQAKQLGQYRLRHLLGAGGMGEVYLAEHQLLKRPCAIKLIRPGRTADPKALARFEREVRTTALLSHPNTIEIYDYGRTDDGTFYYAMEYLRGLSLAELVERHGPLPPERVIYLLRQACGALSEAHATGLTHRDIKPANIFAARRGGLFDFVKLLDFGLVKMAVEPASAQLSRDGAIVGSPLYMSPEQASGEREPDGRSDIYALGAVAYFLLTGQAPFDGQNAMQVMIAHARDPVVPPSKIRTGLPEDLEAVVLRCLVKDPAERFQDTIRLEQALGECQSTGLWNRERAAEWWTRFERSKFQNAPEASVSAVAGLTD